MEIAEFTNGIEIRRKFEIGARVQIDTSYGTFVGTVIERDEDDIEVLVEWDETLEQEYVDTNDLTILV